MKSDLSYHSTSLTKKAAVTMVVHGLNVKPEAMLPLINWLVGEGSDVYLVKLSGHHENGRNIKEVTSAIWHQEMLSGYEVAKTASLNYSVPLFFLGYSLGALLGQSMLALYGPETSFDKQVLLAPATAIRRQSYLVRLLFLLGKRTMIRSYTPTVYRVNKSLPLHIYQVLFAEEKKVWEKGFSSLNIPTLILIDPKDELISYKKLEKFIQRFALTNYQVVKLDDRLKDRNTSYHHLLLSEQSMGTKNWQLATEKMRQFLFDESM